MLLRVIGHKYKYECENLCRVFFPDRDIKVVYDRSLTGSEIIETSVFEDKADTVFAAGIFFDGSVLKKETRHSGELDEKTGEYLTCANLFGLLREFTGYTPDWGILTGVRPSKLMLKLFDEMGEDGAKEYFKEKLFVSDEKTQLAARVAKKELPIINSCRDDSFSLYISIPFCPSRCSYCSFVSHSITSPNAKKLIPLYVEKLREEIRLTGRIAKQLSLRLESIYFGGGTPSSLCAEDLDLLLKTVNESFDLSTVREYTVEAGRPDTVTAEKLDALIKNGVDRVSINPQTFNDEVLKNIGRRHSAAQTVEAFRLARRAGFKNINMDLIAGLSGDTAESFSNTVDTALGLSPENITVHTLALKRSSTLVTGSLSLMTDVETVSAMLACAQEKLTAAGFEPYYMYRQRNCVGNFENVGWCRGNTECLYNIFMMEECHTVLSAGAGAVTKLCRPNSTELERIFNFKYPYEYTDRFDELMERKRRINEFYGAYNSEQSKI